MKNNNPLILFDGVCNLCNTSVQFVLKHENNTECRFAALQSEIGQQKLKELGLKTENFDSIVFIENGKLYQKSTAALKISKYLKFPFNLLQVFIIVPKLIRDFVYNWISKHRYKWFGKQESCWIPKPKYKNRFLD